jgi:hypothetical protein
MSRSLGATAAAHQRSTGRARMALAAALAALAVTAGAALVTGAGSDGNLNDRQIPASSEPATGDRPAIDQREAAESFHHRRGVVPASPDGAGVSADPSPREAAESFHHRR